MVKLRKPTSRNDVPFSIGIYSSVGICISSQSLGTTAFVAIKICYTVAPLMYMCWHLKAHVPQVLASFL